MHMASSVRSKSISGREMFVLKSARRDARNRVRGRCCVTALSLKAYEIFFLLPLLQVCPKLRPPYLSSKAPRRRTSPQKTPSIVQVIDEIFDVESSKISSITPLYITLADSHRARYLQVIDEIFDMVRPENPLHITLADIHRSRMGVVLSSILMDTQAFLHYESRENIFSEGDEGGE